jgi:hypothetical protein
MGKVLISQVRENLTADATPYCCNSTTAMIFSSRLS